MWALSEMSYLILSNGLISVTWTWGVRFLQVYHAVPPAQGCIYNQKKLIVQKNITFIIYDNDIGRRGSRVGVLLSQAAVAFTHHLSVQISRLAASQCRQSSSSQCWLRGVVYVKKWFSGVVTCIFQLTMLFKTTIIILITHSFIAETAPGDTRVPACRGDR